MTRLVTFRCPEGHISGWQVEDDAVGIETLCCETCPNRIDVDVARAEPLVVRPVVTPVQRELWATERSRAARQILKVLIPAIDEYLRLQDMTVEDLPPGSPLRRAMLAARLEVLKSAP